MLTAKVESSTVEQIGWANDTLYVKFLKGGTYAYEQVPLDIYQQMVQAESAGKFLHREIKANYGFVRMEYDPFEADATT